MPTGPRFIIFIMALAFLAGVVFYFISWVFKKMFGILEIKREFQDRKVNIELDDLQKKKEEEL